MILRVTGLRVRGFHGVLPSERRDGQEFVVDVALDVPVPGADALGATVDYADLSTRLEAVVAGEPVDLIETLALRLAGECLADPRVASAEVTVHKPEVPLRVDVAEVSATLSVARAVLSLGTNLGDRRAALDAAVASLRSLVGVVAVSPYYETTPLGMPDDPPDFLNAIAVVTTPMSPRDLVALGQSLERAAGRTPGPRGRSRPLDVDLVAYGTLVSADPVATVPHPRAYDRAFVLRPWLDVDPDAVLPGHGRVADLLPLAAGEVRRS